MCCEFEINPEEVMPQATTMFSRHTKINMVQIPKRYEKTIEYTKKLCLDQMKIIGQYRYVPVSGLDTATDSVRLPGGYELTGKVLTSSFASATHVLIVLATLKGYQEVEESLDKLNERFYLDAWGSSLIEAGNNYMKNKLKEQIRSGGKYYTVSWCPGQHGLSILNQETIFGLLEPQKIQVTLSKSCMMTPQKSVTYVMGVSDQVQDESKVACDFCHLHATCPSAYLEKELA